MAQNSMEDAMSNTPDPTTEIAEALCAADSILSLLRYRHGDQLSGQNREDVNAASQKVAELRSWYETALKPCPSVSADGYHCDHNGAYHSAHEHRLDCGDTAVWFNG